MAKALEEARASKVIGSSLEAKVLIQATDDMAKAVVDTQDPEGFFIVSSLKFSPPAAPAESEERPPAKITVTRAEGGKCPVAGRESRCRR